ncbi:excinuclease ABC subunit UvrC [Rhodoflexus caldus]|uniref:excinuclease ABC subunit UvrC n=1 Tax=Rhodoflexus caldus TaxID=2891236 RepID=UPI00202A56DA|nr:excinuclease ABC subunit UvrC [Rhodoflexus caldus]
MQEQEERSELMETIRNLPPAPGVYRYYNAADELIYVGKAKNLKNRVSSYFVKSNDKSRKTRQLVREIRRMEYTVVNSEFDALLLENNLIKQHQPRYNILLRDDKTYPYLCITNEPFPRLIPTRKRIEGRGTYFGPYASVKAMKTVLELVRRLYTIRTCKYALTPENIARKKFKVCLEYHIKNCKGPCEGLQTAADYDADMAQVFNILKGKLGVVRNYFREQMMEAAGRLAFEEAQVFKEKLEALEKFQSKSLVVNPDISDLDVVTITTDEKYAYLNYLHIEHGCIIQTKTVHLKKKLDESETDILSSMIVEFRQQFRSEAPRVITNVAPDIDFEGFEVMVPKIGDLKKLVELSYKNAMFYRKEKMQRDSEQKEQSKRVLDRLKADLNLPNVPMHIECFDNSNLQGTNPVAAMVCFKGGKPSKKDYRHFNIKTVEGPNDFASMYEIVTRRYRRLLDDHKTLPDLIVIDGGKGQLSAACQALKDLGIYGLVPIVGIAKRLEEIFYPEDELPLLINKKSEGLMLLQRIRDEAHRFAITFHRDQRSRKSIVSQLENIPGIGKQTAEKLLAKYHSVKKIATVPFEELAGLIGKDKAATVLKHLNS